MSEKHVMTYVMGRSRTYAESGIWQTWGFSDHLGNKHDPNTIKDDGKRDIAPVYYPSIGLYDVTDPDYQEYMMQLCKMCYIDTINYYVDNTDWISKNTNYWCKNFDNLTTKMLRKYGLSSTARLATFPEDYDVAAGEALTALIEKLGDTILTIDGRPVLGQFTMRDMTAAQAASWKASYAESHEGIEPFLLTWRHETWKSSDWMQISDGQFGWTDLEDSVLHTFSKTDVYLRYVDLETAKTNHDATVAEAMEYLASGDLTFYAESVNPGFDSMGCSWGDLCLIEPGKNGEPTGELYEYKWQSAVENDFPMVIIPTWDDWGEATTIEPSLEYGITYLEITRKYAAEYKGIEANTANLELPGWIYKIRKTTTDTEILTVMDIASQLIADGYYNSAEALVKPYVEITGIPTTSTELFDYME